MDISLQINQNVYYRGLKNITVIKQKGNKFYISNNDVIECIYEEPYNFVYLNKDLIYKMKDIPDLEILYKTHLQKKGYKFI